MNTLIIALVVLNSSLTPGVVRPLTQAQVCSTKWGLDRRHVSESMRREVFKRYGVPWSERARFEVDHKIPRELGGADDIRNLWPQSWDGPFNAHDKDRVENTLHRLVCSGVLTLAEAQERIRTNWKTALIIQVKE